MSNLIINLNDLQKLRQYNDINHNNNRIQYSTIDPIRCRVLTQIEELEFMDPKTTSLANFYMCNIKIKNIPIFVDIFNKQPQDVSIVVKIDENVYDSVFRKGTVSVQRGDLCEMTLVTWSPQENCDSTTDLWEVVDMKFLTLKDVETLHNFLLSDNGRQFLEISNPVQNIT
ncbi:similar to Kazachstania africana KAFR_0C06340 hypothetical protein [Maudiozyma barnettii]|uniref:Uncharacterized protein n=1 Tax=Maudiozyma barnettii TaxID=61262 RepID=A0A8H2VBB5_9SACH|nr:uncharacterized protein KABA2_01S06424 [Kazachstania barnettii]CAB4252118.1 similar to Kazachstania africana KAFR_0C06340 hypothetical protein [Kazachstania barnettii]CAD1778653.1 similar to Kazachstania africana KAFR_0C06340 hypothetical protein [Kazachstania barnettii]